MSLYEDLKWRGLIKDIAGDEKELAELLDGKPFSFYWGTDPTADSLHIGHYSSLCMAKRLAKAGHHPVLLCGGATGRIGDPRPTAEREIISEENSRVTGLRICTPEEAEKSARGYVCIGEMEKAAYWLQHSLPVVVMVYEHERNKILWEAVTP